MQDLGSGGLEGLLFPDGYRRVETLWLEAEFEMTEGTVHCICMDMGLSIFIFKVVGCT